MKSVVFTIATEWNKAVMKPLEKSVTKEGNDRDIFCTILNHYVTNEKEEEAGMLDIDVFMIPNINRLLFCYNKSEVKVVILSFAIRHFWKLGYEQVIYSTPATADSLVFQNTKECNGIISDLCNKLEEQYMELSLILSELVKVLGKDISISKRQEKLASFMKNSHANNQESYMYDFFKDGIPISDIYRMAYRNNKWLQERFGSNPFSSSSIMSDINVRIQILQTAYSEIVENNLEVYRGLSIKYRYKHFKEDAINQYRVPVSFFRGIDYSKSGNEQNIFAPRVIPLKTVARKIIPFKLYSFLSVKYRSLVLGSANKDLKKDKKKMVNGVNLVGHIKSEHGIGEGARVTADMLDKTNVSWSIYDFEVGNIVPQNECRWDKKISTEFPYNITICNINADQMDLVRECLPDKLWKNGYVVGIWYWELEEFPDEWNKAFKYVDEIWAPTKFIQDSIAKKTNKPVIHMPPSIALEDPKTVRRNSFELPENTFLFLHMYDSYSYNSRKNPQAAIKAFQSAFDKDDLSVGLVLKINNLTKGSDEHKRLMEVVNGYRNIYFIVGTISRNRVNELINCCDVSVSLHRSEGLGLLCKESMYYGKPVIATNWSGNLDFMNETNSCLVDYSFVTIEKSQGPYKAGQRWAEADTQMAGEFMKKLSSDKEFYNKIAKQAYSDMRSTYSPEECAKKVQERLDYIMSNKLGKM